MNEDPRTKNHRPLTNSKTILISVLQHGKFATSRIGSRESLLVDKSQKVSALSELF
jgi:hypothetical protein